MRKIIIAIDGYSACGKSSTAREVANKLGYRYIDSGAMYRAATYYFIQKHIDLTSPERVLEGLQKIRIEFKTNEGNTTQMLLNGKFAEEFIRTMEVNERVSEVSAISSVRRAMVQQQRSMAEEDGIVMDGRDIGTVVFPKAELKIFMTATPEVRAKRRKKELEEKGVFEELSVISNNLDDRDKIDSTRSDSPLKKAEDAVEIDTTHLTFEAQVDKIVKMAEQIIYGS